MYYILIFFLLCSTRRVFAQEELYYNNKKLGIEECLAIAAEKEKLGDKKEASRFLNQAATIYWEQKEYDKAISIFERSLELNMSINNLHGATGINSNLAMIYADMGEYEKSYEYFKRVLEYRKKGTDKVSIISANINIAVVLNNLKRYNEAATYLEDALSLAREMNDADQMKSCYGMLSETYEKAGNVERSIHYFNLYRSFHEMVQRTKEAKLRETAEEARLRAELLEAEKKNKELELLVKNQMIQQQQVKISEIDSANRELLESKTKQELIIALMEREKEIARMETQRQQQEAQMQIKFANTIRNIFIVGFIVVGIFSFILYRNYKEKQRTNAQLAAQNAEILEQREKILHQKAELEHAFEIIRKKNEDITDSISYARRIQNAVLTDVENIKKLAPESFIFFRPRDIVSGDFYWFYEITPKKDMLFAAVDCTGHGVPGALMSMIGCNLLNQIVSQNILSPEKILEKLHQGIINNLQTDNTRVRDGMDVALIRIDRKRKLLEFAGAKNPVWYVKNGEMIEIKGDRNSIGEELESRKNAKFTLHSVPIENISWIYLFSDGYEDQFGGPEGKKFMRRRFKELLLQNSCLSSQEQLQQLERTLLDWMKDGYQVDDILVMGIKV
ncbi:MAG: tetratricopeptide repeat protein [Cytophagales bacterium]|nr:tetratricopeptide repeat protein [Cytophagales bacterium]MDW8383754.1 tetratricopeptide repeat protein [Flammeovirgaceae bacterium]